MKRFIAAVLPLIAISAVAFAQDPPAAPEPTAATEAPQSYRLAVNFEPNSLKLAPLSAAALDSMSVLFALHSRNRYEVHGYTCPTVPGQKTVRLSPQRVELVADHLMALGIPGENIVTVVNAPKAAAGKTACADDRQVDIISTGGRWRAEEQTARSAEFQATAADAAGVETVDRLKAEMADLKRRLAESEAAAGIPPAAPAAEPPPPLTPVQPVIAEQGKQAVAVYMAGSEPGGAKGVHTIMGGELARVLSESDKYTAVDRTDAILNLLDKEQAYQRSGAVDDDQIKSIGNQLGVEYLCISNISVAGRSYYLDTRLVDVVTAEIARSVTATSTLKDAAEMSRVGRNIALELIEADKTRLQRARRKLIFRSTAISLDVLGGLALIYGLIENNNVVKRADADNYDNLDYPGAARAAENRNAAYITGAALIASGITVHIVF
ncbi:hypothetical protein R80B4_00758 [Fibrobacteres bacterium R8-0-B4]